MATDLVVLLGAPTSGKSTIGRLLAERFGWCWCEWELDLLRDWGDRANLIANKSIALAQLHDRVRAMAGEPEMLRRLRSRAAGEHLTDAEALTSRIWSDFDTIVVPARRVDLVIDTEVTTPARACDLIFAAVDAAGF